MKVSIIVLPFGIGLSRTAWVCSLFSKRVCAQLLLTQDPLQRIMGFYGSLSEYMRDLIYQQMGWSERHKVSQGQTVGVGRRERSILSRLCISTPYLHHEDNIHSVMGRRSRAEKAKPFLFPIALDWDRCLIIVEW